MDKEIEEEIAETLNSVSYEMGESFEKKQLVELTAYFINSAQLFNDFFQDYTLNANWVRVNNASQTSFVAVQGTQCTGVAEREGYIFDSTQTIQEQAKSFLDALNEAWLVTKTKKNI